MNRSVLNTVSTVMLFKMLNNQCNYKSKEKKKRLNSSDNIRKMDFKIKGEVAYKKEMIF